MSRIALIIGSTGLVGSEVLRLLLADVRYHKVVSFVRKKSEFTHPKLVEVVTNFDHLEEIDPLIKGHDLFLCLGTTIADAGSRSNFYKVDFTYTFEMAERAKKNAVTHVCLISSLGADARSAVYYSKVKGEIEAAIKTLEFDGTYIVRPSLLLGNRKKPRWGEQVAMKFFRTFTFLFVGPLKKYKAVEASVVAQAMIWTMFSKKGFYIFESNQLTSCIHQPLNK